MKVSINNPCHENWETMTPNEQGAFCLACQKTVVDFSQKTTQEIKDFFTVLPKAEKVCGRFRKDQLKEMSFDDFYEKFKSWILPKKLACVLFFCFGLTLFSCKTTHEPLMGDVAIEASVPPEELIEGKVGIDTMISPDTVVVIDEEHEFKMGEVVAIPPEEKSVKELKSVSKDSLNKEDYIRGKIKIE